MYTDVVLEMCVEVVESKLPFFTDRVLKEFKESEACQGLKSEGQPEKHEAVLRYILMKGVKVRRRELEQEFVKNRGFAANELTRTLDRLTKTKFLECEKVRTPVKNVAVYFRAHRDRIVLNDCIESTSVVSKVVRIGDSLTIAEEMDKHERDVRRVMEDLPSAEGELKAQLQSYLNRRRTGRRTERKKRAKNKEKRHDLGQ